MKPAPGLVFTKLDYGQMKIRSNPRKKLSREPADQISIQNRDYLS